ncbi:MAG: class I SAM-dependent methyltransferase [Oligoflexia bacterium]|nr:class I SAM-dependent methyltransferase [Oligoflexia bacterium]
MGLVVFIKNILFKPFTVDTESGIIFSFLEKLKDKNLKILDVGCGEGRILKQLKDKGYDAVGVEVNEAIVQKNKSLGLNCFTVNEFKNNSEVYDVILMCHIIEHFMPQDLLNFMDCYLDRLTVGGKLIISTPLMTNYFYNDFDHIKPYSPMGISMVFGGSTDQVQYYSKNKIQLVNIKFRKSFFRFSNIRSQYVFTWYKPIVRLLELMSAYVALLTCGLIAKRDGWIGLYQKVK